MGALTSGFGLSGHLNLLFPLPGTLAPSESISCLLVRQVPLRFLKEVLPGTSLAASGALPVSLPLTSIRLTSCVCVFSH